MLAIMTGIYGELHHLRPGSVINHITVFFLTRRSMEYNHLVDDSYQSLCYTSFGTLQKAAQKARCLEAEEISGLPKGLCARFIQQRSQRHS